MQRLIQLTSISLAMLMLCRTAIAQDKQQGVQFQTDVTNVGTSAAAFLEIGVGARAMAMGGAYSSVADDATALYWNSAGIAWIHRPQIELMRNAWIADTKFNFVGLVVPLQSIRSSIGLSITTLDYGSDVVRTVDRPEGTGETFSARDISISISFARALTDRFSFGITGKNVIQQIWNEKGSTAALDFGVMYNSMLKGLKLGVSMKNFGYEIKLDGRDLRRSIDPDERVANFDRVPVNYNTGSYPLPLLFSVGISYAHSLGSLGSILMAVDLNHPANATESINLGAELEFRDLFYIRSGFENLFEEKSINGLTLGGGINLVSRDGTGLRIDYSWSDWGIMKAAQRFSLSFF